MQVSDATDSKTPRFITMKDLAKMFAVSERAATSLIKSGDIPAIQVGGRGVWRIETVKVEEYIARQYEAAKRFAEEAE